MPAKSIKKGNAGLLVLVIILILIVAGLAGAYVLKSFNVGIQLPALPGLPAMTPRATEKDFAFIDDPLIRKHFVAMANVSKFRIKMELTGKGGQQVSEVELTGNDVKYSSWEENSGKKSNELISIGDTTYLRDYKDNTWWKQVAKPEATPTPGETPTSVQPENFKTTYEENKKLTYKKLGEEACGSLTCYKYEEDDPSQPDNTRVFWFDKGQLLLRKEETGFGEFRGTTTYEYDNVNVSAPSPTKDVPAGRSIYEYMTAGDAGSMPVLQQPATQVQTMPQYVAPSVEENPPVDTSSQDQMPADTGSGDNSGY